MSVRPSNACGNGSTPDSRSRSSFARRSASSCDSERSVSSDSPIGRASPIAALDLGDLELALRAARHLDGDHVAALVADERLADRRLVGELALGRIGLGRPDDLELPRVAGLLVLDVDRDPDARPSSVSRCFSSTTVARRTRSSSCAIRCSSSACSFLASSYSEFSDDVAELARLLDALGDLTALVGGQDTSSSSRSFSSPSWVISDSRATCWTSSSFVRETPPGQRAPSLPKQTPEARRRAGAREVGQAGDYSEAPPRLEGPARAASVAAVARSEAAASRSPRLIEALRPLEGVRARRPVPRGAPGTRGRTCAGSARRARAPRCSSRSIHRPEQLVDHLVAARRRPSGAPVSSSKIHGLPSAPRAIITASAPDSLVGARAPRRPSRAHPRRSPGAPSRRAARRARRTSAVVRARPCGRTAALRGWNAIAATPPSSTRRTARSSPDRVAGLDPGAQLHRDRAARALDRRLARARRRGRASRSSAAPAPPCRPSGRGSPC